jgi:hypothetical protein
MRFLRFTMQAQATGWTVHILPAFAAEGLEPDEAAERQQTLESRAERDDVVSTPAQPGVANASTKVPRKWIRDRDPERYLGPRLVGLCGNAISAFDQTDRLAAP